MEKFDAVFIGSGHNALVAAAYLARAGRSVLVLERNDRPGGFVRTDELTLPGFKHDTFSAAHPLFLTGAAYAELGPELEERGLHYVNTRIPPACRSPTAAPPCSAATSASRWRSASAWPPATAPRSAR